MVGLPYVSAGGEEHGGRVPLPHTVLRNAHLREDDSQLPSPEHLALDCVSGRY